MKWFDKSLRKLSLSAAMLLSAIGLMAGDAAAAVRYEWDTVWYVDKKILVSETPGSVYQIRAARQIFDDGSYIVYEYAGPHDPSKLTTALIRARFDASINVYVEFGVNAQGQRIPTLLADHNVPSYWIKVSAHGTGYERAQLFYSGRYNPTVGRVQSQLKQRDFFNTIDGADRLVQRQFYTAGRLTLARYFTYASGSQKVDYELSFNSSNEIVQKRDFTYSGGALVSEEILNYIDYPGQIADRTFKRFSGNSEDGFVTDTVYTNYRDPSQNFHRVFTDRQFGFVVFTQSIPGVRAGQAIYTKEVKEFYSKKPAGNLLGRRETDIYETDPTRDTFRSRTIEHWQYDDAGRTTQYYLAYVDYRNQAHNRELTITNTYAAGGSLETRRVFDAANYVFVQSASSPMYVPLTLLQTEERAFDGVLKMTSRKTTHRRYDGYGSGIYTINETLETWNYDAAGGMTSRSSVVKQPKFGSRELIVTESLIEEFFPNGQLSRTLRQAQDIYGMNETSDETIWIIENGVRRKRSRNVHVYERTEAGTTDHQTYYAYERVNGSDAVSYKQETFGLIVDGDRTILWEKRTTNHYYDGCSGGRCHILERQEVVYTDHAEPSNSFTRRINYDVHGRVRSVITTRQPEDGSTVVTTERYDGNGNLIARDVKTTNGSTVTEDNRRYANFDGTFRLLSAERTEWNPYPSANTKVYARYDYINGVQKVVSRTDSTFRRDADGTTRYAETVTHTRYYDSGVTRDQEIFTYDSSDAMKNTFTRKTYDTQGRLTTLATRTPVNADDVKGVTEFYRADGKVVERVTSVAPASPSTSLPYWVKREVISYYDNGVRKTNDVTYEDYQNPENDYHRIYHYNPDGSLSRIEEVEDAETAKLVAEKPQPLVDPMILDRNAVLAEKASQDKRIVAEDPKNEIVKAPMIK